MPTPVHQHARDDVCGDSCPVFLIRKARELVRQANQAAEQKPPSIPPGMLWIPDAYVKGPTGSGW